MTGKIINRKGQRQKNTTEYRLTGRLKKGYLTKKYFKNQSNEIAKCIRKVVLKNKETIEHS